MKKLLFSAAAICAISISPAQAQSLNYGVMQEMFGEAVTTSANGSPMRASDAPLDMTIISADDIARYPARAIPDILRHYAGVSVRQNSATEYSVGARGYNTPMNERLLVLVNGRQVFEDYFGLVNWSAIPVELNEIRQIEIVRGPNTALFGFNATSGVVNIVTVNPLYDDIDLVEGDIGFNSYKRGSGIYTWQNDDKFGLRISGSSSQVDEDENTINSAVTSLRDEANISRFNADLGLQLNDSTQMRFEVSTAVVDENQLDVFNAAYGRNAVNNSMRANLNSDTDWGIIDATIYRNSFESDYKGAAGTFTFDNDVTVLQLNDTFKLGTDHTIRLAGEYRTNTVDNYTNGNLFGEQNLNITSTSALWYWSATDKLSTSAAIRYDHVNSDFDVGPLGFFTSPYAPEEYQNRYDEYGYNLGLVYKMTDFDTFRLTAARGVDLPGTFELSTLLPGAATFYGNPHLSASPIYDYQIGYERQLSDINGKFKLTGFYQMIDEMQGAYALTATSSRYGNIGDSEVWGIEAGLDGMTDGGVRWGFNYSYSEIEDDIKLGTANFEEQHSEHMIKANLGYSPNAQWSFDAFAAYETDFDQNIDTSATASIKRGVDPDVILDARIAYKPEMLKNLTLSLNGQALFGDNEQSAYSEDVDSQIFLRAKYEF
jgi:outer membrane receptor for ferrienterochelin and colicins